MRFLAVLLALVYPPSSLYSSCLSSQGKVSFDSSDALPWFEHKLFPFQQEGVSRLVSEKRMILADEMGAGKTVQSVVAMNRLLRCGILCSSTFRALIICPKSVVGVWVNELGHWLDDEYASRMDSIHIISAGGPPPLNSLSSKGKIQIINYDVCNKYKNELQSVTFDVLICDEAHYLKSSHTQRTKTIVGIDEPGIQSTYMWLLTGTPILNRPREILPLIWALNREKWPTYDDLERSVFSGADDLLNLRDLKFILRPKILRRKKIDFAQELPPKQISVVILDHSSSIADEEKRFARDKFCQESDSNSTQRSNNQKFPLEAFGETTSSLNHYGVESLTGTDLLKALATIRRFTSTLKLDPAIHLIKKYILTEKVVVFAHHRDLIHGLVESFGDSCVYVHGGLKMESRLHAVAKFQAETTCRIFIGSIGAAGLGINLSVGARVLFLELDYSPSIMTQAEDRCHRFGQKKSVKVEYLVFKDTIDEWIANLLVRKAKIIEHLLSARTSSISDSSTTFKLGFGKYKGCILDEVPIEYINNFLIKQGIYKSNRCLWIALVDGEYLNEQPTILENELLSSRVRYSFDFGRYNGMEWNQVPADYRDWILKEKIWKSFKRRTLWLALYEVGVVGDNPSVINKRREFGFEGGEEV